MKRESLVQLAILLLNVVYMFLLSGLDPTGRMWGFMLMIVAQFFYMYSTARKGQWGIFLTACWFVICGVRGLVNG